MRWISWFILAYLVLGLQTGLEGFAQFHGANLNLVLLAVVFIALSAPRHAALLGCFGLGLFQDLTTRQPLGLFAISYGLVALLLNPAQQAAHRDHPLTQFSAALFGGIVTASVLMLHDYARPSAGRITAENGAVLPAVHLSAVNLLAGALYTAVLAPVALWILARTARLCIRAAAAERSGLGLIGALGPVRREAERVSWRRWKRSASRRG